MKINTDHPLAKLLKRIPGVKRVTRIRRVRKALREAIDLALAGDAVYGAAIAALLRLIRERLSDSSRYGPDHDRAAAGKVAEAARFAADLNEVAACLPPAPDLGAVLAELLEKNQTTDGRDALRAVARRMNLLPAESDLGDQT